MLGKKGIAPVLIVVGLLALFMAVVIISSTQDVLKWALDSGKEATEDNGAAKFFIMLIPFAIVFFMVVAVVYTISSGGGGG